MIHEILFTGEENAQTGRQICELLQISPRILTAAVEAERRQGFPICASTGANPGYYMAADRETMESYCRSLRHRENEIAKTRQACNEMLRYLPERGAC